MQARKYKHTHWFSDRNSLFRLISRSLTGLALFVTIISLVKWLATDSLVNTAVFLSAGMFLFVYWFDHEISLRSKTLLSLLSLVTLSLSVTSVSGSVALGFLVGIMLPIIARFLMPSWAVYSLIPVWLFALLGIEDDHSFHDHLTSIEALHSHLLLLVYALFSYLFVSVLFDRMYQYVHEREINVNNGLAQGLLDKTQLSMHFNWLRNKDVNGSVRIYGIFVKSILNCATIGCDSDSDIVRLIPAFNNLLRHSLPVGVSISRLESGLYVVMAERKFWDAFEEGLRSFKRDAKEFSKDSLEIDPIIVSVDAPNDAEDLETALGHLHLVHTRALKEKVDFARFCLKDKQALSSRPQITSSDLFLAVKERQIKMFFQPKVDIKNNHQLVGAEALARWDHPELGLLSPGDFIDLIVDSAFRLEFIQTVIEQSAHFCETMKQAGKPISVSFNLAAEDLQDLRISLELNRVKSKYGFDRGELQIELSEKETSVSLDNLNRSLVAVKELGYSVALDDFGTGMSSLAYFQSLPADTVKLDRAFINGIDKNASSEHLTSMVVSLAKSEGVIVVAEGVENQYELETLKRIGVDQVQGFFFAKPMSASDFLNFYQLEVIED